MIPASLDNERGFWERREIVEINDLTLGRIGGMALRSPPVLAHGWEAWPRFDDVRDRIARLVATTFADGARWGFKDPRTVMTLALWRDVIGEMDFVVCVRRAEEVVASVQRAAPHERDDVLTQWWLDVNARALRETVGSRRLLVFYEDWFRDPGAVVDRLAGFLHGDGWAVDESVRAEVEAFFDPSLRRASARPDGGNPEVPEADAMYNLLRMAASTGSSDPETEERHAVVAETLAHGHRERMVAGAEGARLQERLDALEGWLEAMKMSLSWRLTAPLRAAKQTVRRYGER